MFFRFCVLYECSEQVYVFACMHIQVGANACTCACTFMLSKCIQVHVHVWTCFWMPKVDTECHIQRFSFFSTEKSSLTELKAQYNQAASISVLESELWSSELCAKFFMCCSIPSALLSMFNFHHGSQNVSRYKEKNGKEKTDLSLLFEVRLIKSPD